MNNDMIWQDALWEPLFPFNWTERMSTNLWLHGARCAVLLKPDRRGKPGADDDEYTAVINWELLYKLQSLYHHVTDRSSTPRRRLKKEEVRLTCVKWFWDRSSSVRLLRLCSSEVMEEMLLLCSSSTWNTRQIHNPITTPLQHVYNTITTRLQHVYNTFRCCTDVSSLLTFSLCYSSIIIERRILSIYS